MPAVKGGDLHTHTTASDGKLTPHELVRLAHRKGLATIAVTDHDTVDGLEEALAVASLYGIEVIPGIELSTEWEGRDVHLLGYYIDFQGDRLRSFLQQRQEARYRRCLKIIARLQELGYPVTWEDVSPLVRGQAVGRLHIAQALVARGLVPSIEAAFSELLERGRPAYVPRYKLAPAEGVEIIRSCRGVAVLAHPGLIGEDAIIRELASRGLQGLEAYYPQHSREEVARYLDLAGELGLLVTGGSDFHGPDIPDHAELGAVTVGEEVIERLKGCARALSSAFDGGEGERPGQSGEGPGKL
ncbi:MAG: PHP domain-containing protein [Thermoanaerobacteraceae bacterium]|nr:PHP domain-containing protein [Thermoanaerobacteraceae bacterium]